MDKETLHKIAFEYINEEVSMRILADRYSLSSATITRYLSGQQKIHLDEATQQEVDRIKQERWLEGKNTRGNLGHVKISADQAKELATRMVDEGLTLNDLHVKGGPSASTIFYSLTEENLGTELYGKVVENYKKNKSDAIKRTQDGDESSNSKARR